MDGHLSNSHHACLVQVTASDRQLSELLVIIGPSKANECRVIPGRRYVALSRWQAAHVEADAICRGTRRWTPGGESLWGKLG